MSNTASALNNDGYMVPLEVLEDVESCKVSLKPPVSRPLPQRPSQVQNEMQRVEVLDDDDYMVPLEILEDMERYIDPLKARVSPPSPQRPAQVQTEGFGGGRPTKWYKCRWFMVGAVICMVVLVAIAVTGWWFLLDRRDATTSPTKAPICSVTKTHKLGCFMDDEDRDLPHLVLRNDELTVEWCMNRCKSLGYRYAGLQYYRECFCGNSFGKHGTVAPSTCNLPCTGNASQTCGGNLRMEIYLTGSTARTHKLGCFMDDVDHDLPYVELRRTDLTAEWCISHCKSLGFCYAGVQRAWECRCGNSVGKHGRGLPGRCSMPCTGNASQTCGAHWRTETYLIGYSTQIAV